MTSDLFLKLVAIVGGFLVLGTVLCLPLFKGDWKALITSSLFTKIIWWIPIFLILMAVLYGEIYVAAPLTLALIGAAFWEFMRNDAARSRIACWYMSCFIICITHLALWFWGISSNYAVILLASVAVMSVLSDVCAFFFGNYLGKHMLPTWLNSHKSWEGVAGQFIGALIGAGVIAVFIGIVVSPMLILIVGLGSAIGDLFNSAAKRSLRIKDWSQAIPGHGGFLDRLSSFSFAIALSYWYVILFF